MTDNQFVCSLNDFLLSIHDCHICKYAQEQIDLKRKIKIFCIKYKMLIRNIRKNCIDRFPGFNTKEINTITKKYRTGEAEINLGIGRIAL